MLISEGAKSPEAEGLYVGAVVMFWLAQDEKPRPGLIWRVIVDDTPEVDDTETKRWTGVYPRLDVVSISPLGRFDGEPVLIEKIPHANDVEWELSLQGAPPTFILSCPRYRLVQELKGR